MFFLKKFLSQFLLPVPVIVLLLLAGIILQFRPRTVRLARWLVLAALALLLIFSNGPLMHRVSAPLERAYPPLVTAPPAGIRFVVVLGGSANDVPGLPATGLLGYSTLQRTAEGVRLYRLIPGSKLLLSGGRWPGSDDRPAARLMADFCEEIGVPRQDLVLEDQSLDTREEARIIQAMVGSERFILVTSAYHMPRSMQLFRFYGMSPIPAPVGQSGAGDSFQAYFPSDGALTTATDDLHEFGGLLWNAVRRAAGH